MLTLQNGIQYVYAKDEKQSTDSITTYSQGEESKLQQKDDTQQSYILVDSSDGKQPLVVTQLEPKIQGVVVVCDGGVVRNNEASELMSSQRFSGHIAIQVCVVSSAQVANKIISEQAA
jgi:stage III sporulation protein AG